MRDLILPKSLCSNRDGISVVLVENAKVPFSDLKMSYVLTYLWHREIRLKDSCKLGRCSAPGPYL